MERCANRVEVRGHREGLHLATKARTQLVWIITKDAQEAGQVGLEKGAENGWDCRSWQGQVMSEDFSFSMK